MEDEVVPKIPEPQAEDHGQQVAESQRGVDGGLLVFLHGHDIRDEVHYKRYNGRRDGVIKQDNTGFAFGLHQANAKGVHDDVFYPEFCHRAREHAENRSGQCDHADGEQGQPVCRVKDVVEPKFNSLHINYSMMSSMKRTGNDRCFGLTSKPARYVPFFTYTITRDGLVVFDKRQIPESSKGNPG